MTCIVGIVTEKGVEMGADTLGSNGHTCTQRKDTKLFKNGEFLIGYTSSFRMGQLLRFKASFQEQTSSKDDYEYMCTSFIDEVRRCLTDGGYTKSENGVLSIGTFLVAYRGRLYKISNDLQVEESIHEFDSCGSGEDHAKAVLYAIRSMDIEPRKKLEMALESAQEFSVNVRAPFEFKSLENKK